MTLPETVVLVLVVVAFVAALVFVLVFWGKLKLPRNLRKIEVGKTPGGTVVYLLHHQNALQEVSLAKVVQAVTSVITAWDNLRLDPRNTDPALVWAARNLDEVVVYVASFTEFDKRSGPWISPTHTAACLVPMGRWFASSAPCILIKDGVFEPRTGEPVQHEMCHALLHEAGVGYDHGHHKLWVWAHHAKPGNLQEQSRLGGGTASAQHSHK